MSQVTVPALFDLPVLGTVGVILLSVLGVSVIVAAILVSIRWKVALVRFAASVVGIAAALAIMSPVYFSEVAPPEQHDHIIASLSNSADVTNLTAEPVPKVDSLHAPQDTPTCTHNSKESHLPYSWNTTAGERVTGSIRKTAEVDGYCTYELSTEAVPITQ